MRIIMKFINWYKAKKLKKYELCNKYIERVEKTLDELEKMMNNKETFIEPVLAYEWYNNNLKFFHEIRSIDLKTFKYDKKFIKLKNKLCSIFEEFKQLILEYNETVANNKINEAYNILGNIEGIKLDNQQMISIVKDVHNHLIIAGAGTGKTTTIIGKIKFLLKINKYKPEEILVLSFTNASAYEMKDRIEKETNEKIHVTTFHKLGLDIIIQVDNLKPKISNLNLKKFIKDKVLINIKSPLYLDLLNSYLLYNNGKNKTEFEFTNQEEYNEYLKLNPPTTMLNELVKSYGEVDIANFLTLSGIKYVYEQPYEVDTRDNKYSQYIPDFYLPDYNIYIEYFGINKEGEVPSYFESKNGLDPSLEYKNSMEWKRKMHKQNKTIMIECFAYEKFDGILIENLQKKLINNSVKLIPKTSSEIWNFIESNNKNILDGMIDLFETVINLIKSNEYTIADVEKLSIEGKNIKSNKIILELIKPIYKEYCSYLKTNNEIDFNDMINLAKNYIEQKKYINPYKYVIVDEYQDISKSRFSLIKSLRESYNYDLFCVGDDWQSIYRFNGSDIGFILNFEEYWGPAEISKIETTYRFSQKLTDVSSKFIMRNPVQIRKEIKGKISRGFPVGEIIGYTENNAIEFMLNKLIDLPKNSTVFLIGRYSFDLNILPQNEFKVEYNNSIKMKSINFYKRPDLKISFLTAHKSKGLEADFVFIINNKNSIMGFPSNIQDSPILNLLLENYDEYLYSEERRLFYVALTRSKVKTFLIIIKNKKSSFIKELENIYEYEFKKERFECPWCGGQLIMKSGPYGKFLGCENYDILDCKYTRNIKNKN